MQHKKFKYKGVECCLVLLTMVGSRLYNTHYEKGENPLDPNYVSDHDYKGVFVINYKSKIGFKPLFDDIVFTATTDTDDEDFKSVHQFIKSEFNIDITGMDFVLYELKKIGMLTAKSNPNILDMIFAPMETMIWLDDTIQPLIADRRELLTKSTIAAFQGYACEQMNRMKNHNKVINKKPYVFHVIDALKSAYSNNDIDKKFIADYFSSELSMFIANAVVKNTNTSGCLSFDEFKSRYCNDFDLNGYIKPKMEQFLLIRDKCGHKLHYDDIIYIEDEEYTVCDILNNYSSSRTIFEGVKTVFFEKNGGSIFDKLGMLKVVDKEFINTDKMLFIIQTNNVTFKQAMSEIHGLWDWVCNRNSGRYMLEEQFGYDTKHGGHLIRLLLGAKEILNTHNFTPYLSGETRKLVMSIRHGEYTYDQLIALSNEITAELELLMTTTTLKEDIDRETLNEVIMNLSLKF